MNKRKVKKKLHLNNKGIDGKIANNTTFDFDSNILEKNKSKEGEHKTKYRRLGAVITYDFVYFCDGSCKWMVGV